MILCYLLRHHFVIPRLRSIGSDKEGAHALLHLMKSDMVGGLEYALHGTGVKGCSLERQLLRKSF